MAHPRFGDFQHIDTSGAAKTRHPDRAQGFCRDERGADHISVSAKPEWQCASVQVAQNAGARRDFVGGFVDQSVSMRIAPGLSLTAEDVLAIEQALPRLLGCWRLLTEVGEEGEYYGRLLPPWSDDDRSAFLIEREDSRIILTDNLSQWDRCAISSHPTAAQAMAVVQRVVHGAG